MSSLAHDSSRSDRAAYGGLIFATLLFSFTAVFIRLSEVGPAATGFWRFLITIPFMLLWIVIASRRNRVRVMLASRHEYMLMLFAALMLTLNVITWQSAVTTTSIANAVLLSNLHPIVVAIGAYFLFRERITLAFAMGLILALAGTGMLVREGAGVGVVGLGDGLALLGAIFFGLWVLCLKNQRGSYSTPVTMLWNIGLACPMILVASVLLEDGIFPDTPAGWGLLGGYAITINVIALSLYAYATGRLPASISAAALLIVPVFSSAYGWILFDERLSLAQGVAGLFILIGLFVAQRGHRPPKPPVGSVRG